ncbi:hypothetical protein BWQ96_10397 [Gracilariopsis chorda]|uniref:Uncharacterized protein n=1 Tax=Gracilariopsis chorda TaxID=448386 RepID=A0A2V3ICT3_9FLOR|nr:hypothetical protein BWQ96_10397 [Gracilariopsis chorda]|eukprot:PXF39887.1 hypothetical protein BWQ96_10397 [Gracilariopsis chorda]
MLLVGINEERDKVQSAERLLGLLQSFQVVITVEVLRIFPWGAVTHALNLLTHKARTLVPESNLILFQSPEVDPDSIALDGLLGVMTKHKNTLVVGHSFKEHNVPRTLHRGSKSILPIRGDVCPWNTMALWNVNMLSKTGFPAVADQVNPPGMEEIGVIALQQQLYGCHSRSARLYCGPGNLSWTTNFDNLERQERHSGKLASKVSRGKEILKILSAHGSEDSVQIIVHFN